MIVPVILSGGSGTRLWPISRALHPKQFISLINESTLFQDTILRLPKNTFDPLIVCSEEHRFLAAEQLREIEKNSSGIILEPFAKNTAPAITLAALHLIESHPDCTLLILPADHFIEDIDKFHNAIDIAFIQADKGKLVAFGVEPSKANSGYGYIEVDFTDKVDFYDINSFKEKPDLNIAQSYIDEGNYFWNSGIFMFKASTYLEEIKKFEPEILSVCKKTISLKHKDFDFIRIDDNSFKKCPIKSIDYAVMEKTDNSIVVPLETSWTDLGSWESLWEFKYKDIEGNVANGDVILDEVKNCYVSSNNRLVAAIGLNNLFVIDTEDTLLVADKNYLHKIKLTVDKLNKNSRKESSYNKKVYRPWGSYDSLDFGPGFKVKRITINPGSKISLQKHQFRAEHWVVVQGIALITFGDKVIELKENQSTYIPKGELHRLENQQNSILEIIEIQTGEYLNEDDIIRLEDDYGRD